MNEDGTPDVKPPDHSIRMAVLAVLAVAGLIAGISVFKKEVTFQSGTEQIEGSQPTLKIVSQEPGTLLTAADMDAIASHAGIASVAPYPTTVGAVISDVGTLAASVPAKPYLDSVPPAFDLAIRDELHPLGGDEIIVNARTVDDELLGKRITFKVNGEQFELTVAAIYNRDFADAGSSHVYTTTDTAIVLAAADAGTTATEYLDTVGVQEAVAVLDCDCDSREVIDHLQASGYGAYDVSVIDHGPHQVGDALGRAFAQFVPKALGSVIAAVSLSVLVWSVVSAIRSRRQGPARIRKSQSE